MQHTVAEVTVLVNVETVATRRDASKVGMDHCLAAVAWKLGNGDIAEDSSGGALQDSECVDHIYYYCSGSRKGWMALYICARSACFRARSSGPIDRRFAGKLF